MHLKRLRKYTRFFSALLVITTVFSASPVKTAWAVESAEENAYIQDVDIEDDSAVRSSDVGVAVAERSVQDTTAWLTTTSYSYTGKAICPKPLVYYNNEQLIEEYDYTLEYQNNVEIGTASVIIHGAGDYSGYKVLTFAIGKRSLTDDLFKVSFEDRDYGAESDATYYYTGDEIRPSVKCTFDGQEMKLGVDYKVSFENNENVGQAVMTFTGIGEYANATSRKFAITSRDILDESVEVYIDNAVYTGNEVRPDLSILYNGYELKNGKDFNVEYTGDVEVGTATLAIEGKGNFSGSRIARFNIIEDGVDLSKAKVKLVDGKNFVFTGDRIRPGVQVNMAKRVLQEHSDYEVVYDGATEAGKHVITIRGKGKECYGHVTAAYRIKPGNIDDLVTVNALSDVMYTGEKIEQKPVVWFRSNILEEGKDYKLRYAKNLKAGTSSVKIQGKGSFKGRINLTYQILPWDINDAVITTVSDLSYNGKAQTPKISVSLNNMSEKAMRRSFKIVVDKGAIGVGKYEATLIGKGSISGVATVSYNIVSSNMADCSIKYPAEVKIKGSTGKAVPKFVIKNGKVRLKEGRDYTVSIENNERRGTARATITGVGGYSGQKAVYFRVK